MQKKLNVTSRTRKRRSEQIVIHGGFIPSFNMKAKQNAFFGPSQNAYGGILQKKRKGRLSGRPLSTKTTMHLVLRSSKAKGIFSFKTLKNEIGIREILKRFSEKYSVKICSTALLVTYYQTD